MRIVNYTEGIRDMIGACADIVNVIAFSRVAQRKRAGPITQRSVDRNHPLLHISKSIGLSFRTN